MRSLMMLLIFIILFIGFAALEKQAIEKQAIELNSRLERMNNILDQLETIK